MNHRTPRPPQTRHGARRTLALALSCLSLVACAQTTTPPGDGPGPRSATGAQAAPEAAPRRADGWQRLQAQRGRMMEELKAKLQITPAQEPAWSRFTEALGNTPAPHAAHAGQWREIAQLTTPERIDRMKALRAQHHAEMLAYMDRRGEATKAFYASLDEAQKKTFDAETARWMQGWTRGPEGQGHGHGHGHGHGGSHGQGMGPAHGTGHTPGEHMMGPGRGWSR